MDDLELFKKVLTASAYPESAYRIEQISESKSPAHKFRNFIVRSLRKKNKLLVKKRPYDAAAREEGKDWPMFGYTMVGHKRLNNVQAAIEHALQNDIPGDFVECGVWRGGCAMFMKAMLQSHGDTTRRIWLADSFAGLPKPNETEFPDDKGYDYTEQDILAVPMETVKANFERFDLLDDRVEFLPGWFKDTLPDAKIDQIAVLRADGDLYESTIQILDNLYDKVSPGGYVIIDDYKSWPPCKKAVDEFRARHGIDAPIQDIDWTGVYWIKD